MMQKLALVVGLFVGAVLSACTPFQFDDQDIGVHVDFEQNRFDLWITYHDVRASSEHEWDATEESLKRIVEGKRHFVLWDIPIDLDDESAQKDAEETCEIGEEIAEAIAGVSVLDAGARFDAEGRPAVWQKIRIENTTLVLDLCSRGFNEMLRAEVEVGEGLGAIGGTGAQLKRILALSEPYLSPEASPGRQRRQLDLSDRGVGNVEGCELRKGKPGQRLESSTAGQLESTQIEIR